MGEAGLDPAAVSVTEVRAQDDAERLSFVGSPTIRVDGADVDPPEEGESRQPGLSCRIYRRQDGRVSPLPDGEQVREALRKATKAKGDRSI
jgi:hypothetical protein